MNKPIPHVAVAAGIIWRGDRFLAALRPDHKPRGGYWEFPGGKQEQGENMEQTLARELMEELGIECQCIVPWQVVEHSYADMHVILHFMHVTAFAGEPMGKDGQTLDWLTPAQAQDLPFLPADLAVLGSLRAP